MKESIVQTKSFEFSLKIINLYKKLQEEKEFIISRQILRSNKPWQLHKLNKYRCQTLTTRTITLCMLMKSILVGR